MKRCSFRVSMVLNRETRPIIQENSLILRAKVENTSKKYVQSRGVFVCRLLGALRGCGHQRRIMWKRWQTSLPYVTCHKSTMKYILVSVYARCVLVPKQSFYMNSLIFQVFTSLQLFSSSRHTPCAMWRSHRGDLRGCLHPSLALCGGSGRCQAALSSKAGPAWPF